MEIRLEHGFEASAKSYPERMAVEETSGRQVTYVELSALAERLKTDLEKRGVAAGDRVGIMLPKSIEAVAGILATLKCGAAYVPLDADSPASRIGMVIDDAKPGVVITDENSQGKLPSSAKQIPIRDDLILLEYDWPAPLKTSPELAYILYTSGSTGHPKGVMLTHRNAISFVDWCSQTFDPSPNDRFSSVAPFHFDLSILDIFVSLKHGAALVLIGTGETKSPMLLAEIASQKRISIWYATPTTLGTMAQFGKMEDHTFPALRLVLYAGEVFPMKSLNALRSHWPHAAFYNLYGPTETNVCTFFKLADAVDTQRSAPYPIGKACSHCRVDVVNESYESADQGEIIVTGEPVMQGYLGHNDLDERVFIHRHGERWYKTGDLARRGIDGNLEFIGRKDRMVKRRGYRIELAEIEAALHSHPDVSEVGVTSHADPDGATRIVAHIGWLSDSKPSLIAMKQFCMEKLPVYMVPDQVIFHDTLPKTSTDKLDYKALQSR